ncbi:hypothetical protein B0J14DRAFT_574485 [Halenospora varia]|nr:hypothetical protein B0J14DRAFT_574485 [Halenospora varia]
MYQTGPGRAFALQKYLLLHSQQDALQKHLNHISTSLPSTTNNSPAGSPEQTRGSSFSSTSSDEPSSSPRGGRHHYRSSSTSNQRPQRPQMLKRRSSLPAVINETILEIEEDESKLKDVNQQIKSTLTDLLNCDGVRSDQRYRTWVQTRLMDTEKELKNSRSRNCERRRSEDFGGMLF